MKNALSYENFGFAYPGMPPLFTGVNFAVEQGEFVLLCGLTNKQVDEFLARSREAGCSVGTKALLTKVNRTWPLARLMDAVAAEHAQMADGDGAS